MKKKGNKRFEEMTVAEMLAHADKLESYRGTKANKERMQAYQDMENNLKVLRMLSADVVSVESYPPAQNHANATLSLDLGPTAIFHEEEMELFRACVNQADGMSLWALEERTRILFFVEDLWEEYELDGK